MYTACIAVCFILGRVIKTAVFLPILTVSIDEIKTKKKKLKKINYIVSQYCANSDRVTT